MTISICVIAYNEEKALPALLKDIQNQDYPHKYIEVILVNSMSQDRTREIMEEFAERNQDFLSVRIFDNPQKKLAPGWNIAVKEFVGDAILRVDAHANIPMEFISKNIKILESGEFISAGKRPNIIDDPTPWKETLLLAEQSMFGSSVASYRRSDKKAYVKSVFHGAYRKEVFEKVGLFNENLGRTEDNEMNYRIRQAGFQLCYSPEIISYQHVRNSFKKMLKQKYSNGYWIGLTTSVCPQCLSFFHFIPFMFICAILLTTLFFLFGVHIFAYILWGTYGICAIGMSILAVAHARKHICQFTLPLLFLSLHISYGIGTLIGFCNIFNFKKDLALKE